MLRRVFLFVLVCCAGCASHAAPAPNAVFDAATKATLTRSNVPVYLPAWIPPLDEAQKTLYASVTLYPQGYLIAVDPIKGCDTAGACSFIVLTAHPGTPATGGSPVTLQDGSRARFHEVACGASCGPASLEWTKGPDDYTISMKGGDQTTLVKIADSYVAVP